LAGTWWDEHASRWDCAFGCDTFWILSVSNLRSEKIEEEGEAEKDLYVAWLPLTWHFPIKQPRYVGRGAGRFEAGPFCVKKITAHSDWAEDKFMCHCKSELADFNKAEIGATCLLDRILQILTKKTRKSRQDGKPSPGQSVLWSCGESQIGRWGMRSWTMVALGMGNGWFKSKNSFGSKPTNTIFRSRFDASPFSWPALFFGSQILLDLNQRLWGRPEAWIRHLISRLAESKKIYLELHWYIWYIYIWIDMVTPQTNKNYKIHYFIFCSHFFVDW
jgi:hypothetical protein